MLRSRTKSPPSPTLLRTALLIRRRLCHSGRSSPPRSLLPRPLRPPKCSTNCSSRKHLRLPVRRQAGASARVKRLLNRLPPLARVLPLLAATVKARCLDCMAAQAAAAASRTTTIRGSSAPKCATLRRLRSLRNSLPRNKLLLLRRPLLHPLHHHRQRRRRNPTVRVPVRR